MFVRRMTTSLKEQHWMTIVIELVIVIVGVFIGTQVSNWNEARVEKAQTQRMLDELIPELRSELDFFEASVRYYATTRGYADRVMAGWDNPAAISDSDFVIAAYQASQVNGIGMNPDSWALTFGGEQLRNIADPLVRRDLEIVLTSDYTPVEFTAVMTAYREQVRHIIPIEIQDRIRIMCGDRNVRGATGAYQIVLPNRCGLKLDPRAARETAAALRARPGLPGELRWHLSEVATFLANCVTLSAPMRELEGKLSSKSR
jgi:hypothetical protein